MKDIKIETKKQHLQKNYILLIFFCIVLGGLIGVIAGSFMYAQHYLIEFIWETIPEFLGGLNPFLTIGICVSGGLVVGIGRKFLHNEPQPMQQIIRDMKAGKNLPGIKTVPSAFLISLISLGFGAALGPEAALVGITVGFGSWAGEVIARLSLKLDLTNLQKSWLKIPGYLAMISGFSLFVLVAMPIFSLKYSYFPYQFSLSINEILIAVVLGLVGFLLGKLFSEIGRFLDRILIPLKNKPILSGMMGGVLLGGLGIVSPLILFSGQLATSTLFTDGLEMSGLFLILIGLLKMVATKTNTATGWKGGEFFPMMFASAAIGLGISNLIPGIPPMVAIAALMAATITIVMGNIYIALAIVLMFLPAKLFIPMLVASCMALLINKRFAFNPKLIFNKVAIKKK